jgi:hypothetical protein
MVYYDVRIIASTQEVEYILTELIERTLGSGHYISLMGPTLLLDGERVLLSQNNPPVFMRNMASVQAVYGFMFHDIDLEGERTIEEGLPPLDLNKVTFTYLTGRP